jgi:hypothetical protein
MKAIANATTGVTTAFIGTVNSKSGIAAIFNNNAGGPLASFRNSGVEKIGFDATGDVTAAGVVTGSQLVSTIATGTPPLTVASTTMVANLDAEQLGGFEYTAYPRLSVENTFPIGQVVNDTTVGDGLSATTTVNNGTGAYGEADNGSGATGVFGFSNSGIGVGGQGQTYGGLFWGYGGPGVWASGTTYGGNFTGSAGPGVYGSGTSTGGTFTASSGYGVSASGTSIGVYAAASNGQGVYATGSTAIAGSGTTFGGTFTATAGEGVTGSGTTYGGVFSASAGPGVSASGSSYGGYFTGGGSSGVYGKGPTGVYGTGTSNGVYGTSTSGSGVWGVSATSGSAGVEGSTSAAGAIGVYGQWGTRSTTGAGYDTVGSGVWGDTASAGFAAILGTTDDENAGYFVNNSSLYSAVYAENNATPSDTSYVLTAEGAGVDSGNCTFSTTGKGVCSGGVSMPAKASSGRELETPAMFTTENWLEDFGTGQLQDGKATVELEANFAELVNTGAAYHVFLTPKGDSEGLYVTNQTATSFEVREARGGHANIAFDYRIVAKRRGAESARLRDVTEEQARIRNMAAEKGKGRPAGNRMARTPEPPALAPLPPHPAMTPAPAPPAAPAALPPVLPPARHPAVQKSVAQQSAAPEKR